MTRLLFIVILLFAAPFAAFALYQIWNERRVSREAFLRASTPVWLTAIGVALALAGILTFSSYGTLPAGGVYVPERYEDGKLIPGYIRPDPNEDGEGR